MIQQIPMEGLYKDYKIPDLNPQAIIAQPISYFARRLDIERSHDDLDYYEGAAIVIDRKYPVALKHYRGHPTNTTTIYLSSKTTDIDEITQIIRVVLEQLNLPIASLQWERRMNPEL